MVGEVLVVGAVLERGGRLFLARRSHGGPHGGRWELPGGKVEAGEAPECALERELREELLVEARVGALLDESAFVVDGRRFRFQAWAATIDREPRITESHAEFAWFAPDELPSGARLAPLDAPALAAWIRRAGGS